MKHILTIALLACSTLTFAQTGTTNKGKVTIGSHRGAAAASGTTGTTGSSTAATDCDYSFKKGPSSASVDVIVDRPRVNSTKDGVSDYPLEVTIENKESIALNISIVFYDAAGKVVHKIEKKGLTKMGGVVLHETAKGAKDVSKVMWNAEPANCNRHNDHYPVGGTGKVTKKN